MTATPLVTVKTRTMIVFRWGGVTIWLKDEIARQMIAENKRLKHIAYVVRCRPRVRR